MSDFIHQKLQELETELRLLRAAGSHFNAPSWSDVRALEEKHEQSLKAAKAQIAELVSLVNKLEATTRAGFADRITSADLKKSNHKLAETLVDAIGDDANDRERAVRKAIDDTARALQADVATAKSAAMANIATAQKILLQHAAELGS